MSNRFIRTYRVVPLHNNRPPSDRITTRPPCAAGCHRTARRVGMRCRACTMAGRPIVVAMKPADRSNGCPPCEQGDREARIKEHEARVAKEMEEEKRKRWKPTEEERKEMYRAMRRRQWKAKRERQEREREATA